MYLESKNRHMDIWSYFRYLLIDLWEHQKVSASIAAVIGWFSSLFLLDVSIWVFVFGLLKTVCVLSVSILTTKILTTVYPKKIEPMIKWIFRIKKDDKKDEEKVA